MAIPNWFICNEDTLEICEVRGVRNPHAAYKTLSQVAFGWLKAHTTIFKYVPTSENDRPWGKNWANKVVVGRCNEGRYMA